MYQGNHTKPAYSKFSGTATKPRKSIALSQNFINNRGIISTIMGMVDLHEAELVVEVGPGKGIITDALIKPYNKVVAVEIDHSLFTELKKKYSSRQNLILIQDDFLKQKLPKENYIVVANIPFNITADIIKKITDRNSLLQTAYLITEKEAAYKFVGAPYAESPLLAHFLHIHYDVKFLLQIERENFTPVPRVDIGFISIKKRRKPIFNDEDENLFKDFLTYIFSRTGGSMHEVVKSMFSNLQGKIILEKLRMRNDTPKKKVLFLDWVKIFETFKEHSPHKSREMIKGAFEKLNQDKANLNSHKNHRHLNGKFS